MILFCLSPSSGLVQRCVIIQKDQHGFGFTVSGDRIVLVQSVRPGECRVPLPTGDGDTVWVATVCVTCCVIRGRAWALPGGVGSAGRV